MAQKYRIRRRPGAIDKDGRAFGEVDLETDEYKATIQYVLDRADLRFPSITVEPLSGDIPSTLLRHIPIGTVRAQLRDTFKDRPELASLPALLAQLGGKPATPGERELIKEQARRARALADFLTKSKPKRGPGAKNDEHWAAIAELYLNACRMYGQKAIGGMVEELENRKVYWSHSTVKTYVRRARELEWLSKGSQGKAGADPGPKLIAWRKEHK